MSERDTASILTDSQRAYLKGEKEPQNPRNYDKRIRDRITAAMGDFAVLFENLPDDELAKIFGSSTGEQITEAEIQQNGPPEGSEAFGNSFFAFAFLARALNLENERVYPKLAELGERQIAFQYFIEQAELGIDAYLREYHRQDVSVSVSIDIESAEDYFPEHDESGSA